MITANTSSASRPVDAALRTLSGVTSVAGPAPGTGANPPATWLSPGVAGAASTAGGGALTRVMGRLKTVFKEFF